MAPSPAEEAPSVTPVSTLPSDLPGPVAEPGVDEAATVLQVPDEPGSALLTPEPSATSLVNAPEVAPPAPVAADGEVVLAVQDPWYVQNFASGVSGAPVVTRRGTPVPEALSGQVVSVGAASGVTIVKR